MSKNSDQKVIASNMFWRFADRWGSQLISLVIGVIIARMLEPEDYGIVTLTNVFISIVSVFTDCGLADSIIQKKDADELDYATAFFANLALCIIVYLIIFICAPYVAIFYGKSELVALTRVLSIRILISGFKNIHHAYVAKNMLFKKYFFASLIGTIGSGVVGIIMALKGYGPWALIISTLFDVFVDTIFCWIAVRWHPKLLFSFERLKELFSFGSKLLISNLIDKIYSKMYQLVTGKFYTSQDLAYFDKGDTLTNKVTENIDYTLGSVLFPTFSNVQDDKEKLKKIAKETLKINVYIIYPLLIGLLVVAKPAIVFVFTDKWIDSVPYVQIFCLIRMTLPFTTINSNAIKSLGKSDIYLRQQTIIKIINTIVLLITVNFGIKVMALGLLLVNIIGVVVCTSSSKKYFDYGLDEQMKDILPTIFVTLLMGIIVFIVGKISLDETLLLFMQVLVGALIYIFASIIIKHDVFYYVIDMLKNKKSSE